MEQKVSTKNSYLLGTLMIFFSYSEKVSVLEIRNLIFLCSLSVSKEQTIREKSEREREHIIEDEEE